MVFTLMWLILHPLMYYLTREPWSKEKIVNEFFVHLLPWLSTQFIVWTSDITIVENDWLYCFYRAIHYIPCNISGFIFAG